MTLGVQKAWNLDYMRRWDRVLLGMQSLKAFKQEGALEELKRQMQAHLLDDNADWQNQYIEAGYQRGMRDGSSDLAKAKITETAMAAGALAVLYATPAHQDRVQNLFTTALSGLRKITTEVTRQVAVLLPTTKKDDVAKMIIGRVEHIGKTRSTLLAKSDTVKSHHIAKLQMYREEAVTHVTVEVEWVLGPNPCPICIGLSSNTYTINEIEGIIPVHPGCQCSTIPVNAQLAA
jgi:hypothetical protein